MATRLKNLLRGQSAALHAHSTPDLPDSVCLRRSLRCALHIDLLATVFKQIEISGRKFWCTLRELSGDDAYERYLAHHSACHTDTAPQSRKEFFRHEQQHKWEGIKRCC